MHARIDNPALAVPGALEALRQLSAVTRDAAVKAGVPRATLELVNLRASQINGCSVCVDMHTRGAKKAGEADARLFTVSAWRDAPYFTEEERAALALTEAATRLADRDFPQEVFDLAAKYYSDAALTALIVQIATINAFNRINVTTGQVAGEWTEQWAS
jgi:AhpD family alkylhydroperoxidase